MFVQARRWAMVVGAASLALIGCGGGASRHSASAGTAAPTSRRADAALATRFQHALDTARASIDSPGASAAVLIPGQPLWAGTSGFADVRSHRRVTPGALFEIASVTKTLTAALVLKLTERHVAALSTITSAAGCPSSRTPIGSPCASCSLTPPARVTSSQWRSTARNAALGQTAHGQPTHAALRHQTDRWAWSAVELLEHRLPAAGTRHRARHTFDDRRAVAPSPAAPR